MESIEPLIQRGLVQSLGRLTDTNDPTLQMNLLIAFTNLARKRVAKDQIALLPQVYIHTFIHTCIHIFKAMCPIPDDQYVHTYIHK